MQRLLLDYINIFSKMAQCKDGFPNTLALSSLLIMGSSLWCANLQYCSTNNWPGLLFILSNDGLHLWFIQPFPRGHEKCWIYILGEKSLVQWCWSPLVVILIWGNYAVQEKRNWDSRNIEIESKKRLWMVMIAFIKGDYSILEKDIEMILEI